MTKNDLERFSIMLTTTFLSLFSVSSWPEISWSIYSIYTPPILQMLLFIHIPKWLQLDQTRLEIGYFLIFQYLLLIPWHTIFCMTYIRKGRIIWRKNESDIALIALLWKRMRIYRQGAKYLLPSLVAIFVSFSRMTSNSSSYAAPPTS